MVFKQKITIMEIINILIYFVFEDIVRSLKQYLTVLEQFEELEKFN